uniref:Globin family profile domain-containing protein n=1 Tax=Chromera velia CCMP2878 TaxID=1169474 RepID=A0A0G4H6W2_9ALVE|eukprot:Cvel_5797.t1-p1 / transcript=Cvel_5797.t1 / gene=Cvel_5797 / organism=Chromera_velia_CCMP2878 / gene_product=hypothetical protein / transcript_product=hypothetical protein / location=Cvel_scaffold275:87915-105857(-) / protein_length=1099 / sequence_SO=supercontig / SO=protein_coding / is_pseudo=false
MHQDIGTEENVGGDPSRSPNVRFQEKESSMKLSDQADASILGEGEQSVSVQSEVYLQLPFAKRGEGAGSPEVDSEAFEYTQGRRASADGWQGVHASASSLEEEVGQSPGGEQGGRDREEEEKEEMDHEHMAVREGEGGGDGDGEEAKESEESMRLSEKGGFLTQSLLNCLKAGTAKDNVGSLTFDGVMNSNSENEMIKAKGKTLMTRAFQDAIGLVAFSAVDNSLVTRLIDILALRHHHYGVTADLFPQMKAALVDALEMLSGDNWDSWQEKVWKEQCDVLSTVLIRGINSMGRRLELIRTDWKMTLQTLGEDALAAKISANLITASSMESPGNAHESPASPQRKGKGVGQVAQREAMLFSKDIGKLLVFLVGAIDDLPRLRGLIEDIRVPWDQIFSNYGSVPNMQRVKDVVLKTMEEVVGGGWEGEHEESWTWLLDAVVDERKRRWRSIDKDRVLQGYQAVEAEVMRRLQRDNQDRTQGRDFYAEDSSVKDRSSPLGGARRITIEEGPGKGRDCDADSQNIDGCEEAGGGGTVEAPSTEKGGPSRGVGAWARARKAISRSGAFSQRSKASASTKQKHLQKLQERMQQGYPVKPEVVKEFSKEFFRLLPLRAPNLGVVFEKQEDRYETTFQAIPSRLFAYIGDPQQIWLDDTELAVRHIEYGISPADIPIFGGLFLKVLENIAQGAWVQQYSDLWQKSQSWEPWGQPPGVGGRRFGNTCRYWNIAASGLAETVCAGLVPMTRALVYASLPNLKEALADAPRGTRIESGYKVVINGNEKSPLFWMLKRGRILLARHILRDILAIRQNKSGIMYGKQRLWETHGKHLVERINNEAPDLWSDIKPSFENKGDALPALAAVVMILAWLSNVQLLLAVKPVMHLLKLTAFMMGMLLPFVFVLGCLTVGFTSSIWVITRGDDVPGFETLAPDYVNISYDPTETLLLLYSIIVYFTFLPTIVAIFVRTVSENYDMARQQALFARTQIVLDIECSMHRETLDKYAETFDFGKELTFDSDRERESRYANEEGLEIPWPQETLASTLATDTGGVQARVKLRIGKIKKGAFGLSGVMKTMLRVLKKEGKIKGETSDGLSQSSKPGSTVLS